jgi:hypothetical protein
LYPVHNDKKSEPVKNLSYLVSLYVVGMLK